jgi:hypothetical protein
LPSNGSRQCSNLQPEYINISPGFKVTFTPGGAFGLCMFLYSSMTLFDPVGSMYIGHKSPPKLSVVDISQLGLSLCLFNIAPFS